MAYLQSRLSLKQVAWEFNSSVRVFNVPRLVVTAVQDVQSYKTANGTFGIDSQGLWLSFRVESSWFKEQVSGTATDRIDILNALKGTGTVYFYPDYGGQNTIKYAVKTADTTLQMLTTNRGLFNAAQSFTMQAVDRLNDYPDWLRYT